ncbi:ankyrin repeat domain-containing protein [Aspergillus lucknowensis]|uniref:Ankyrin repeat-containing domain protein n=1 Tax=Aspergillus lucknowensis TaxID=176173 RepID=A0ABR4LNZ1_9EURO
MFLGFLPTKRKAWLLEYTPLPLALITPNLQSNQHKEWAAELLYEAVSQDYLTAAKRLLLAGAGANTHPRFSNWPQLLWASQQGSVDMARLLLDHGADVSAVEPAGNFPLYLASINGHSGVVNLLLERGADLQQRSEHYGACLDAASRFGCVEVVRVLIEHGGDLLSSVRSGLTPLETAARYGQANCVRAMLEMGSEAAGERDGYTEGVRTTRLCLAVGGMRILKAYPWDNGGPEYIARDTKCSWADGEKERHAEILRMLLERGADMESKVAGFTPLHIAAIIDNCPALEALIEKGADIHALSPRGRSALEFASLGGHAEIVEALERASKLQFTHQ